MSASKSKKDILVRSIKIKTGELRLLWYWLLGRHSTFF